MGGRDWGERARALERATADSAHAASLGALAWAVDSVTVAGIEAVNAAVARAVAAEAQGRILRRWLPSTPKGWAKVGAVGVLAYLAGQASR